MEEAVDGIGDAFSTLADEVDANVRSAGSAAKAGRKAFLDEWKKQRESFRLCVNERRARAPQPSSGARTPTTIAVRGEI
jgi:hypothetical protein